MGLLRRPTTNEIMVDGRFSPALRAGRAFARITEKQPAATPPLLHFVWTSVQLAGQYALPRAGNRHRFLTVSRLAVTPDMYWTVCTASRGDSWSAEENRTAPDWESNSLSIGDGRDQSGHGGEGDERARLSKQYGSTREIASASPSSSNIRNAGPGVAGQDVDGLVNYDALVVSGAVFAGHWILEAVRAAQRCPSAHGPVWLFSRGPIG